MLCVNKSSRPSSSLGFSNNMKSNGSLTGRFRPEYFNDTSFRNAAYTQGNIKSQGSGRNYFDLHPGFFSKLHYSTLAELFLLSLIHISEPTRLGMISYAVFC